MARYWPDWPLPRWPGDVIDAGDRAEQMLEEVPAEQRLYTFEEMIGATDALGSLPESPREWGEWFAGHVEHMAAGGYVIGRPDPARRG